MLFQSEFLTGSSTRQHFPRLPVMAVLPPSHPSSLLLFGNGGLLPLAFVIAASVHILWAAETINYAAGFFQLVVHLEALGEVAACVICLWPSSYFPFPLGCLLIGFVRRAGN